MSRNIFGELVRRSRSARGISLRALAEELEYSPAYLSDVENGKRNPFSDTVITHLANFLGMKEEELKKAADLSRGSYTLVQSSPKHNEVAAALVAKWEKLKPEQLEQLLKILES